MKAAIYSRKSIFTGKGESIENQIELCKDYSQKLNITEYYIYEDEGFSGGNTNRPQFQQLLKDAKSKKFDVLVCYRLDRISRNVADFSTTLEMLQQYNIDFISIKEQFDTTTPMGRAMIYISSVFAQLERETIAERVRDNMLQLAKSGRWLGGQEPYGFTAEKITYADEEFKERSLMKLSPLKEELEIIKMIFNKYIENQSISQVVKHLMLGNFKGKNGGDWATMQVRRVLKNPLYVKSDKKIETYLKSIGINVYGEPNGNGYLTYNKTKNVTMDRDITEWIAAVGKHSGVIDSDLWLEVQALLDTNKNKKIPRLGTGDNSALLPGLLKCKICGANMKIKQGHKSMTQEETRYDYYVCGAKENSYGTKCKNSNIRVDRLDNLVLGEIRAYNKELLMEELAAVLENEVAENVLPNQIHTIRDNIRTKEKEISNLVKELRKDSDEITKEYIRTDIKLIHSEITKLKENLEDLEQNNNSFNEQVFNTQLVIDSLDKFNNEFDTREDMPYKRKLLKDIIEHVTWDGLNQELKIVFFTGDKKK